MIDKQDFLLFLTSKVKNKKSTINLERLATAFLDYHTPTYKLLGESSSTLSAKLKRLFKDNLVNKPRSMTVDSYFLLEYGYKFCGSCKELKNTDNFYACRYNATGKQSECIFCIKTRNQKSYNNDSTYSKNKSSIWRKENRGAYNALMAKRRASKLNATPKWLSVEQLRQIQLLYIEAKNKGMVVDHIIPLQGTNVCGLHVPWNLQLLSAKENLSKSNKVLDKKCLI